MRGARCEVCGLFRLPHRCQMLQMLCLKCMLTLSGHLVVAHDVRLELRAHELRVNAVLLQ